uniref:SPARK domain-containing protein n=1 Tax=Plectus sambesii TaxID=2011161 RepID=A0A914UYA7_9BILA
MVVLDSPSRLNRSQVTSMYEELHANTILTPSSFNELPSIPSPATPCRPSTVPTLPSSPESHPSHNTSATEDPDSCEIMVALLISCSAGDDNLEKVKNFVKGNIINCMKDTDEEGAKGLYMYYPGVALDSSAICTDFDCVDGALSQMKLESSCIVTPENTNDVDDNDAYTELAVSIGFTKLLK